MSTSEAKRILEITQHGLSVLEAIVSVSRNLVQQPLSRTPDQLISMIAAMGAVAQSVISALDNPTVITVDAVHADLEEFRGALSANDAAVDSLLQSKYPG